MQLNKNIHWIFFVAGITDILILDFVTKLLVVQGTIKPFVFIENLFYIVAPYQNDGIAFGIDLPMSVQIVGSLVILVLLYKIGVDFASRIEKPFKFQGWLLGAVIGGGLGNLIDRVLHGYVVDFIVLRPFPVFNVADVGITVGLLALFAIMWLTSRESETKN